MSASRSRPRIFWICAVLGWLVMAYGVWGLVDNATLTNPEQWIRWFIGSLVVHDFVIAPLTFAVGAFLVARVPRRMRAPFQAGLIASAVIVLTTWPLVRGYGLRSDNPSALPNDYLGGLAMVLIAVWSVVAAVAWRARKRP
ncbi:MAG TPA: hypothetical protein VFD47_11370 [Actinomycetota bacterium]|nr:hypothetical protein [Actinomycetota bacterium]